MSSWNKVSKAGQKFHRERSQPEARRFIGMLEKKKDYKKRAEDFHKRERRLKFLKKKAQEKNPDEFYFNMINTRLKDGVHKLADPTVRYTEDELKLMNNQDWKYVTMKRVAETKKIDKLKSSLHLISASEKPKGQRTIFVDDEAEATKVVSRLRKKEKHSKEEAAKPTTEDASAGPSAIGEQLVGSYRELSKRIDREKTLHVLEQKLQLKRVLMRSKGHRKKKVKGETEGKAAVYLWKPLRQR